jgi:hypothetical protein
MSRGFDIRYNQKFILSVKEPRKVSLPGLFRLILQKVYSFTG